MRFMRLTSLLVACGAALALSGPPITRGEYPGFVVYFEHNKVIHTVVAPG